jgi:hypothetical protein
MYIYFVVLLVIIIILVEISFNKKEGFENIPEDIGNYLSVYFHQYILSIFDETDFIHKNISNSTLLKYLPQNIPYNKSLKLDFEQNKITKDMVEKIGDNAIWYCEQNWIIDLWEILKPTIHDILDDCIKKSGVKRSIHSPIIHFRCADTPFIKHGQYFFQKYEFFEKALEKINEYNNEKKIVLMANTKHNSGNKEKDSCAEYAFKLRDHIQSLGYDCTIETKTNIEDFVDLFYAPAVVSTGSSFSFMSGFFGDGIFITTEHCREEYKKCDIKSEKVITGYNIHHNQVDSYYDIDTVFKLLNE